MADFPPRWSSSDYCNRSPLWSLASRWIKISLLYGGLGIGDGLAFASSWQDAGGFAPRHARGDRAGASKGVVFLHGFARFARTKPARRKKADVRDSRFVIIKEKLPQVSSVAATIAAGANTTIPILYYDACIREGRKMAFVNCNLNKRRYAALSLKLLGKASFVRLFWRRFSTNATGSLAAAIGR